MVYRIYTWAKGFKVNPKISQWDYKDFSDKRDRELYLLEVKPLLVGYALEEAPRAFPQIGDIVSEDPIKVIGPSDLVPLTPVLLV